jgi:hypothetical protein
MAINILNPHHDQCCMSSMFSLRENDCSIADIQLRTMISNVQTNSEAKCLA